MANYEIAQYAYAGKSGCLIPYPTTVASSGKLYPVNILGSQDPTGDFGSTGRAPYQQIILNGKYYRNTDDATPLGIPTSEGYFDSVPYFLRLTIPRNANYDLDFALLLIEDPNAEVADLDQMTYQFVRYIHVPRSTTDTAGQSFVVAYERPKFYDADDHIVTYTNRLNGQAVKYGYTDTDVIVKEAKDYSQYKDKTFSPEQLAALQGEIFFERSGSIITY